MENPVYRTRRKRGRGGGKDEAQLIERLPLLSCLPSVYRKPQIQSSAPLGSISLSIWEMGKEESEDKGYPQLYRELENSLSYVRLSQ